MNNPTVSSASIEYIRERMGSETSTREAIRFIELLVLNGYADVLVSDIDEQYWISLIPLAID